MHTTPLQRKHNADRRARKPTARLMRLSDANCNKPRAHIAHDGNAPAVDTRRVDGAAIALYLRRGDFD